jgi:hypothetical protein
VGSLLGAVSFAYPPGGSLQGEADRTLFPCWVKSMLLVREQKLGMSTVHHCSAYACFDIDC